MIQHLDKKGEKILWAPDKHLGHYVQKQTGADMFFWDGSCVVHEEFKSMALRRLRHMHPEAAVLAHPESHQSVIEQADVVGSTTALINSVVNMENRVFIIATDAGIFHKMKHLAPAKQLIEAPTAGDGATCESCAHCPWMEMNSMQGIAKVLETGANEIQIDPAVRQQALSPIKRMLDFSYDSALSK